MSTILDPILSDLLRYLSNDCPADVRAKVDRWIAEDASHRREFEALETAWSRVGEHAGDPDVGARMADVVARRIVAERSAESRAIRTSIPNGSSRPMARSGPRIAVLGALGIVVVCLSLFGVLRARHESAAPQGQRYHTAQGQRSTVQLRDGVAMLLAPATTVTTTSHEIEVTGEGYFTVTPSVARPVIVRTRNTVVQVLGTRFSVRQYPNESTTRVIVDDGKVALRTMVPGSTPNTPPNTPTVLTATMAAQISDSGIVVQEGIRTGEYTTLAQGRLVFTSVPLGNVVQDLSRAYGADIRVTDSALAQRRVTLAASVNDMPLSKLLTLLTFTVDAHYASSGTTIMIVPGAAASPLPRNKRIPTSEKMYGR